MDRKLIFLDVKYDILSEKSERIYDDEYQVQFIKKALKICSYSRTPYHIVT
jgi:hypothetical protein